MPPIAYLYAYGLPFAGEDLSLTSSPLGHGPRVVVDRGRVIDLDSAAVSAGVLLGSTIRQAKQVCPSVDAVGYDPAAYEDAMRPLRAALWEETDRFEVDGSSGLFIDLDGGGEPVSVVRRVWSRCPGISVTAAVSGSKFMSKAGVLAALAAQTYYDRPMYAPLPSPAVRRWVVPHCGEPSSARNRGRRGQEPEPESVSMPSGRARDTVLELVDLLADDSRGGRSFLQTLPVGFIWPVAEEVRERLFRLGIKNCADLARVSRPELFRQFGAEGYRLANLALGVDREPVRISYTRDEIVRRLDFDGPVTSRLALKRAVAALSEDLANCMATEGQACRVLCLVVRFETGAPFTRQRVFSHPVSDGRVLGATFAAMLGKASCSAPVLGVEISAAGLEQAFGRQLSFLPKAVGQQVGLMRTLSSLERRFSGEVVRLGMPPPSRRERMLALADPVRWRERAASTD